MFSEDEDKLRNDLRTFDINSTCLRYIKIYKIIICLKTIFLLRINVNNNGDIDLQSLMEPWQGNYDVDWCPSQCGKYDDNDISIPRDVDKAPCPSLSELQLHKTKSRNKCMS